MVASRRVERFGSYGLEQTINVGSVGEVFLARWLDREGGDGQFVIKRLHRELARRPAHVELFVEEGKMAQRFAHPNLVRAFDAGSVERGRGERDHYIAMDLVRGPNLAQLSARGPVPARAIRRIARDLCAALAHVHAAGVVHCDVSPTNILIGPERTQLTDFGVANPSGQPQPQVRGTLAYMSPEQARGQPIDGRSDVFSVGVVGWELLARRPLFLRAAPYLTLAAVVEDPVPAFDDGGDPSLSALARVLRRALERDVARRWASCEQMAAALDQH
ncbi:MAG TPA: serine/threonine-protein kinase [Kofleriaceae bacterium]|nr:serine/threonine-protein kinase [Kofleriaceae bacterium]